MLSFFTRQRIRGGVHAEERKVETATQPIVYDFPLPKKLYIPLQQHVGKPAEPLIRVGDKVLKGQLLAYSQGMISAPVHAPSSGIILDVNDYPAPHPSALPIRMIVLETDGKDEWIETCPVADPFELTPEDISLRVGAAGIVGLGGATFPTAVKLNMGRENHIDTLIINGAECEPYLSCDDRQMQERAEQIIDGVRLMLHGMETEHAVVAIEDNKPQAFFAMRTAAKFFPQIKVIQIPTRYPMGWDRQLIRYVTGKEVPVGCRSSEIGVTIHNVGTAYATHKAIRHGQPLVSRVITVSGGAVGRPMNVEVPLGTLISELFNFCKVNIEDTARIVMGGPMMGDSLPHAGLPTVKATSGILALTQSELKDTDEKPCIRCASCVTVCPAGLRPLDMANNIRVNQLDAAVDIGLKDCISCGCCSYICPSNIPLVQYFKYASGEVMARQQAAHKSEQTKRLIDDRNARLERIAQQQREEELARLAAKAERERLKAEQEAAV
ncbi:MAG: electron transport complex subunit RsxC [Methylococcaceae bacterium]|uniref:electron transport complex subunit RsxC n=1 Tax=Methylicorpusculum sp. TaxID=2713644 RepID=UPI00271FFC06|nr:electron transport complex subunit RsxC [Methylicorpusculum sp.]MDO9160741.1 electron transport complex subunit RsxC [Methylococcaceae bacterium]MDZ4156360.1 electron transport complex subunit RsxC [Methylococcales bacterium]MDP2394621.1 electron transport complex subunit RsxC [Methylococcaceae bacterium]MDP3019089.1 electron transport complex subunit RsxC [Methylococcaceae bacterium]MDP3390305.1 electron transport complex subunit RsxC [Methylococcaceae bacterium]